MNVHNTEAAIIAAGLSGLKSKADPGPRLDIDMYAEGHTVTDAKRLPLNLLDAIRTFEADTAFGEMLGTGFAASYAKLKHREWLSYTAHFSQWEKDTTLDI